MAFNPRTAYDIERTNQAIFDFHQYAEDYEIRPPYQRKAVWEKRRQQALMDSLFRRYYIPSIVLREVNIDEDESKWEVVDGQQRITSVQNFFRDKLPLPDSLADISPELPKKHYSDLPTDIKKFVDKHLKFDIDIIKHIGNTFNSQHQEIATEIFWRLQQGEKLNKMETAHARLSSPVRNFLVKYADDYDFNHEDYSAIDPNPHKHIFFRETYTRTNSRMQHLTLLGRLLLLERAGGSVAIGDSAIARLIDNTQRKEDGIGNQSFENEAPAKATLRTLNRLHEVFEDDPKLDREGVGVLIFKDVYFIVSFYQLLSHLLNHYVYSDKLRLCYREFAYDFFERTTRVKAGDENARNFVENRQQDRAAVEERERIIRFEFFEFAGKHSVNISPKDEQRSFTEAERIHIYIRDRGICQMCKDGGKPENEWVVPWSQFEADHVLPHSKGGQTLIENGQVLCREHNRIKGAAT